MLSEFRRPQIVKTSALRTHNLYTTALDGEFRDFAFNEERAPLHRGSWRREVFSKPENQPMDLEIGTGNGVHFQHHCLTYPQRLLVGIELKYKPLIQTIRRALKKGATNGRICRIHAFNVDQIFAENEIDDIYVHFPDPWVTPRKPKNRLMNPRMLEVFWSLQRPGSRLDFKTDSREMYLWALQNIRASRYQIEYETMDLHRSSLADENIITQFERIFMQQGTEINFVRLRKT
jgi:tRNA (guanine-N7-)-methyltransferase